MRAKSLFVAFIMPAAFAAGAVRDVNNSSSFSANNQNPLISVQVAQSYHKFMQDEVSFTGSTMAEVSCAKNEAQSFQILVINNAKTPLPSIDLAVSGWQGATSNSSMPVITLFREHYVQTKKSSGNSHKKLGNYPDALIPFINPYTQTPITSAKYLAKSQTVMPSTSQGYWVDIYVDKNVLPGVYKNEIVVSSNNNRIASVPVTLTVMDFELPNVLTLKSWFGPIPDVSGYHSVAKSSAKYSDIEKRYMLMLRQHLAVPVYSSMPKVDSSSGAITFTPEYVQGLRDYLKEVQPPSMYLNSCFIVKPTEPAKPTQLARYLSDWQKFIEQNPWIPEPFVLYDEPQTLGAYKQVIDYGKVIHKNAPSIKFLVTTQVEPKVSGFPSFEGYVDIWCPLWHLGNPDSIARRQKLGDKVWSYVALTQSTEVPTWLIDFPLIDYRIPAWFSWSLGLEGILYWHTMAWATSNPPVDPWVNSETCVIGPGRWNGEGSLVYPGGAAGIDGPVASMRLKAFRDGVQDHEYLYVLSQLIGKDETKKISMTVAKNFKTYSKNPDDYVNARKQVAERILLEKAKLATAAKK